MEPGDRPARLRRLALLARTVSSPVVQTVQTATGPYKVASTIGGAAKGCPLPDYRAEIAEHLRAVGHAVQAAAGGLPTLRAITGLPPSAPDTSSVAWLEAARELDRLAVAIEDGAAQPAEPAAADAPAPRGPRNRTDDRRRALAEALISLQRDPGLSDRQIAKMVGRHVGTVTRWPEYRKMAANVRGSERNARARVESQHE
jgi:hypothetical protein